MSMAHDLGFTINPASLYGNAQTGVNNPMVFYTGSRDNSDIYLWRESDGSKGVQDPWS